MDEDRHQWGLVRGRPQARGDGERRPVSRAWCVVALAAVSSAGCMETRFSLKELSQPVTLSRRAAIGSQPTESTPRGTYLGETSKEFVYGTIATYERINTSQLEASAALGGQDNRAIVNLSLDVWDYMFGFGIYQIGIRARGDVIEVGPRELSVRP